VGADLVGKVEAGIPEDDPRNPAVIADNVGDNVGDVAGMGADLFESYCGSILAACALGAAAYIGDTAMQAKAVLAPMLIAGIGILLSIIGIYFVKTKEDATQKSLLDSLSAGINLSSVLIIAGSVALLWFLDLPNSWGIWGAVVAGLVTGIVIGKATEYYTSSSSSPTRGIAAQAEGGAATTIIAGISVGMLVAVGAASVAAWVGCATGVLVANAPLPWAAAPNRDMLPMKVSARMNSEMRNRVCMGGSCSYSLRGG